MGERKGIMLASSLDIYKFESWNCSYIAQPKLKGVRCRAIIKDRVVTLLSSEENRIVSVPHINVFLSQAKEDIEFDGELYVHGMSLPAISGITKRTRNIHPNFDVMEYHMFDIVENAKQTARLYKLDTWKETFENSPIKIVESVLLTNSKDMTEALTEFMRMKYEGIILRKHDEFYQRKRVQTMMKFKPREKDEYLIVGTKEEISIHGDLKGTLGAFICEKDGQLFGVGTGPVLTKEMRQKLWDNREVFDSRRFKAVIKYEGLTPLPRNVPYCSVIVDIIKI